MSRGVGGGPVATTGPAAVEIAAARSHDHEQGSAADRRSALITLGEMHPPAGRRTMPVLIVKVCPACGRLHLHRVGESDDGARRYTRTGSCGATYEVVIA